MRHVLQGCLRAKTPSFSAGRGARHFWRWHRVAWSSVCSMSLRADLVAFSPVPVEPCLQCPAKNGPGPPAPLESSLELSPLHKMLCLLTWHALLRTWEEFDGQLKDPRTGALLSMIEMLGAEASFMWASSGDVLYAGAEQLKLILVPIPGPQRESGPAGLGKAMREVRRASAQNIT